MKFIPFIILLLSVFVLTDRAVAQETPVIEEAQEPNGQDDGIIEFPDVEAEFKGGHEALTKFITNNVHYPFEARKNGIQGRVFISFVVRKSGRLSNIKIERGVNEALDLAAVELIEMMPRWKPAEKDGKKVNCKVMLPIVFQLEK